jgi:integrase
MATFTKRKLKSSITWQAKIRRRGRPTVTQTFVRRADAEAWASTLESEMARGIFLDRSEQERVTIRDGLDRYKREITPSKRSAVAETRLINAMSRTWLADYTFASLRAADVARWRDERLTQVSSGTVLRGLALLGHLFKIARCEWGMEGLLNPVESVRKPKQGKARSRRLMEGEEAELLARARQYGDPIPSIITLALETAMRRGEIAGLRWENVDLKRRVIRLLITKNGDAREVPLSSRAIEILVALPRRIDGWVFGIEPDTITQAFGRITGNAPTKLWKGRSHGSHLSNLRFHDLRHEATSRLFERGFNPIQVAAITGHKTLEMLKRYTHLKAEDLAQKLG